MKETDQAHSSFYIRPQDFSSLLEECLIARSDLPKENHHNAFRLFNGFFEGVPGLVIDIYDDTLVLLNHSKPPDKLEVYQNIAVEFFRSQYPWLRSILLKYRHAYNPEARKGILLLGEELPGKINEFNAWYALNLRLNQDCSFYLDTRNLRKWLIDNMQGKSVINFFSYTGSLGIAALVGGASKVIQNDLNVQALKLAEKSAELNNVTKRMITNQMDFFRVVSRLKARGTLVDCVILDPPFFSSTADGVVQLGKNWMKVVNKVRPLVAHGGRIITVNNALFVSGQETVGMINALSSTEYLSINQFISVPEDITGYPSTIKLNPPVPTFPFNHPTKIIVFNVFRKDRKPASLDSMSGENR